MSRTSFPIAWRDAVYSANGRVLSWRAKAVAGPLSTHMDLDGSSIWPSIARLAAEASIGERTAGAGLRELRGSGFLIVTKKGGGRNRPTLYRATIPPLTRHDVHRFAPNTTHDVPGLGAETRHVTSLNLAPRAEESAQEGAHSLQRAARARKKSPRMRAAQRQTPDLSYLDE